MKNTWKIEQTFTFRTKVLILGNYAWGPKSSHVQYSMKWQSYSFLKRHKFCFNELWSWPDFEWRCGPPLIIFAPPLKSHALPLGKVSMIDQSANLTFFGCLGSTLRKIETVIAFHLCVKYPFNTLFWKKLCSNCNEGQNWMSCTVIIH